MKITNKLNLPESFINYMKSSENHTFEPNRYSVTEILGSPRQIYLTRKHFEEIKRDVSDMIPALFGTAVHSVLEKNVPNDCEAEFKVQAKVDGITLTGIIDLLNRKEKTISDYKTCSVSKVMKNDFEDWKLQGLIYAWICYFYYDIDIRHLRFYALMKDWSKLKSSVSAGYPVNPIYTWEYEIQDSDYDFISKWIKEKLYDIVNYYDAECSEEDRWYTGTKYAVYKNENDERAKYVGDTLDDANNYLINKLNGVGHIVERKGDYLKCNYYCDVKEFCSQWKK